MRDTGAAMSKLTDRDARSLLRTENLVKSFGGVRAVDHLSLQVSAGELRCLIGPNGAGKSTLFGLLSGLHRPDSGHIWFKGEDITRLPPHRRVRKGLCQKFQTTRIYRDLTVAQNSAHREPRSVRTRKRTTEVGARKPRSSVTTRGQGRRAAPQSPAVARNLPYAFHRA